MDDADLAEQREQRTRDEALAFRYLVPVATGACHWCSADLWHGGIFCGAECRDDWQREQDAKRRNA